MSQKTAEDLNAVFDRMKKVEDSIGEMTTLSTRMRNIDEMTTTLSTRMGYMEESMGVTVSEMKILSTRMNNMEESVGGMKTAVDQILQKLA